MSTLRHVLVRLFLPRLASRRTSRRAPVAIPPSPHTHPDKLPPAEAAVPDRHYSLDQRSHCFVETPDPHKP